MSQHCSSRPPLLTVLVFFIFLTSCFAVQAAVPASKTFSYTNEGDFGDYTVEYSAWYRLLPIGTFPFQLSFFNTTPNAFTLGIRFGDSFSEPIKRWVWEANRGRPVHENATFTFRRDGNLVLADADGTVVWQTGTANKGVVGLDLLGNGNLVLYDKKGKYVWQSFDHPTDTLLVGQSLRYGGPNKIVSRVSDIDGSSGPYSFGIEGMYMVMYYKSPNSPKPLLYYRSYELGGGEGFIASLKFSSEPETNQGYAYELGFSFDMGNSSRSGTYVLTRPRYNSTYSMIRVESDGNLRVYTYYENAMLDVWEMPFKLFGDDVNGCQLPRRCGSLGVCEDNMCVGCPTPKGLSAWSRSCAPPRLPPCKAAARGGGRVGYYKVVGVEHFLNGFSEGEGPMKLAECMEKCTKDCGCLGFFYREESSKCLLVPELGTLSKVSNSSHVGYIKMSK